MFGEFTVPAYLHDNVYFELVEAGFKEVEFPEREEKESELDFL